jgi:pyruvate/2-oxoglutarate/acetoin dehydrogenase E1 component
MELTVREALNQAMRTCMAEDESVVMLGEDIGAYGGIFQITSGLQKEFGPLRVMDTPIAENGFCGAAAGMALAGLRPVVEIMLSDFILVCADGLGNQIAKLPVMTGGRMTKNAITVRVSAGIRGGGPQSGEMFEALFAHLPGWKIVAPSNAADAKGLLISAIRDDSPVLFLEHAGLYEVKSTVGDGDDAVPIGRAAVAREGTDVTVVSYSHMVAQALVAADALAGDGISAEVIDLRTLVPLDLGTVKRSIQKTGRLVLAHEARERCGIGAEIAAQLASDEESLRSLRAPICRVAARNVPLASAKVIEDWIIPTDQDVAEAVRLVMKRDMLIGS